MIKTYNQHFYPNPFRHRQIKNIINNKEVFEEVQENLIPFLDDKFSIIEYFIDEFGDLKSELKVIRNLREKIRKNYNIFKNKTDFFSKHFLEYFDQQSNIDNYQKNLRYLELPVQPLTDKRGFEIQFLSSEIIEDALEEIDEGFTFIYDYCSNFFPESTELWTDYALFYPEEFPFVAHDFILESTYEIFDKIFEDIQKNSVNMYNWVIAGDLNSRLLKIIRPKFEATKLNYVLYPILESLLNLILMLLIIRYLIIKSKPIITILIKFKNDKLTIYNFKNTLTSIRIEFNFQKFLIKQKTNKFRIKALNLKTNFKYTIIKILLGTTNS